MKALSFESLGLVDYVEARAIQEKWRDKMVSGAAQDIIFFCQHPPTVTLGKRGKLADLPNGGATLGREGIALHRVSRGGEATLHSPGQIVVYPVISLRERGLSVREFVLTLLNSAATLASHFGISASAGDGPPGVFVENRKLAAVGLQISRGVTNHGMSLNVANNLQLFSLIVPCGRADILPTSLSAEAGADLDPVSVEGLLKEQLEASFAGANVVRARSEHAIRM